ncbi:hypothetical protein AMTR_s00062p00031190 [Amborella trichopoda]|uniref:Uncharacterized protein n=1 Tax=Amborella trichopoda TaxID=13333 RepID=U5DDM8_AMBTC|nr:hypothetical protein AMTR_s00062p00031190 [Amborella trichopoda]
MPTPIPVPRSISPIAPPSQPFPLTPHPIYCSSPLILPPPSPLTPPSIFCGAPTEAAGRTLLTKRQPLPLLRPHFLPSPSVKLFLSLQFGVTHLSGLRFC